MEDHEELLEQGETLAEEGLFEEALARFEQALQAAPENPETIEATGRALLSLDRLDEAEARFRAALALDAEWPAPRMGLAALAMRREEAFKAVHHLERAIETDPELAEAYVELGRYYGLIGEPELARETFARWTANHPEDADVLINAGLTSFDAEDYEVALEFFGRAAEAADGADGEADAQRKSGANTYRANALDMLGRYPEAIAAYEEVISDNPEWWEAHANLGICHARNNRLKEAEAAFRRGLEDCPGSPEVRDELAAHLLVTRRNMGDLEEALALAEEAVALGRDEVRHLHTLGEARLALEDEAGAMRAYQAVLDLDPLDPAAHLELGLLHEKRDDAGRAEEHYIESLKQDPANPRALYSYASLYYAADDLDTAEELLTQAVAAEPVYAPALSALASIRARQGDRSGALSYLGQAVQAGENDAGHFAKAPEFADLRDDPEFQSLIEQMGGPAED